MNQTSIDPARIELTRVKAYEIWLGKGCPQGSAEQDWLEAEHAVSAQLAETEAPRLESESNVRTPPTREEKQRSARPAERPGRREASHPPPATSLAAESSDPARAATRADAKSRQAARMPAEHTPEQKIDPTAGQKMGPSAEHVPTPTTVKAASETKAVATAARGRAKGAPAKARARGRTATAVPDVVSAQAAGQANGSRQSAPTDAPVSGTRPGTTARSGTRRAAGSPITARQRKG